MCGAVPWLTFCGHLLQKSPEAPPAYLPLPNSAAETPPSQGDFRVSGHVLHTLFLKRQCSQTKIELSSLLGETMTAVTGSSYPRKKRRLSLGPAVFFSSESQPHPHSAEAGTRSLLQCKNGGELWPSTGGVGHGTSTQQPAGATDPEVGTRGACACGRCLLAEEGQQRIGGVKAGAWLCDRAHAWRV